MSTLHLEVKFKQLHSFFTFSRYGFDLSSAVFSCNIRHSLSAFVCFSGRTILSISKPYLEKVKKECKKLDVKLELFYANRLGIFNMIKLAKEIIIAEKNNYIYVNVASGSKIQAIACMMACMILKEHTNIQPFYAEPETYAAFEGKQQSFGLKDTIPLPTYEIQTPKQKTPNGAKLMIITISCKNTVFNLANESLKFPVK